MKKNLTLIVGHNSALAKNFIERHPDDDMAIIGRNISNASFPFLQTDLSRKLTDKDFDVLDTIIQSNKIRSIIWFAGNHKREEVSQSTADNLSKQLYLDVINPLEICARYLQNMKNNDCSIIFISSLIAHRLNKNNIAYSVGKSAQISLMKNLAYNLGKYNIRCNSISPSLFQSNMSKDLFAQPEKIKSICDNTPLKRIPSVEHIVNLIDFLHSSKSNDITGQDFIIDCGNSLGF